MDKQQEQDQWSIKLDNGEIFVRHANNWNELKLKREEAMIFINSLKRHEEIDSVPIEDELREPIEDFVDHTKEGFCRKHIIEMKKNKNDKWYHREYKENKTRFCNGYAWGDWI